MVGITGGSALSDYRSRSVVIEVAGMANQTISRVSNYQVKVPFSQLSAALHTISCQGGKVVNVDIQGGQSQDAVQPTASGTAAPASDQKVAHKAKNIISRLTGRKGRRSKKTS
ncbi:phycobilisome-associated family protein [Leptolyngbya sp. Heron Island J]|uniref:phycobilisome-associated family protein n=1 Tax=Leptolyngbya sp. Heron Island J TaxID=1385935 RepID=UPI0003B9C088|nr:phycobilisome-associated family protein [Leptolyngbya sp. Heron Island J]ESA36356.1 phycobilisome-associated family protein [Leptolyngbya sp. Heron Island J]